jgi:hypothetical protein
MDQAVRMLAGDEPVRGPETKLPNRSFTPENTKELDLSHAEENDLGLYVEDPEELTEMFEKQWGL